MIFFILGLIILSPELLAAWTRNGSSDGTFLGMTIPVPQALIQVTMFLGALTFMYVSAKSAGDADVPNAVSRPAERRPAAHLGRPQPLPGRRSGALTHTASRFHAQYARVRHAACPRMVSPSRAAAGADTAGPVPRADRTVGTDGQRYRRGDLADDGAGRADRRRPRTTATRSGSACSRCCSSPRRLRSICCTAPARRSARPAAGRPRSW